MLSTLTALSFVVLSWGRKARGCAAGNRESPRSPRFERSPNVSHGTRPQEGTLAALNLVLNALTNILLTVILRRTPPNGVPMLPTPPDFFLGPTAGSELYRTSTPGASTSSGNSQPGGMLAIMSWPCIHCGALMRLLQPSSTNSTRWIVEHEGQHAITTMETITPHHAPEPKLEPKQPEKTGDS